MGINEAIDVINERMGTTASIEEMNACSVAIAALDAQNRLDDMIALIEYVECGESLIEVSYLLKLLNQMRIES